MLEPAELIQRRPLQLACLPCLTERSYYAACRSKQSGRGAATGEMGPKSDAKRELQKKFGHVTAAA